MANTPNRNFPLLPAGANGWVSEDLATFNALITALDQELQSLFESVALKLNQNADFPLEQVQGLISALNEKAAAAHQHSLNDLSDVDVSAAANGYLLALNAEQWVPTSVNAAFGNLSVNASQVQGLDDALALKASGDDLAALIDVVSQKASLSALNTLSTETATALDGKSNTGHGHAVGEISGVHSNIDLAAGAVADAALSTSIARVADIPSGGVQDVRLGAVGIRTLPYSSGTMNSPTGCVFIGVSYSSGEADHYNYKPIQKLIDGVWYTVSG